METVNCLLCGGSDHEPLVEACDSLTGIGGLFRIVRCRGCQLAFTNPRPAAASLGQFYPAEYSPHFERERRSGWRARWRRRLEYALLRQDFGYPPQPSDAPTAVAAWTARALVRRTRAREHWIPFRSGSRLLDFGCGGAAFLPKMRDYGWTVEGLDMSPRVVEALARRGFRAHLGSLPHPDIPAASFDAVTMWHSLEHVPRPLDVLRAAASALRPGGILVVGVPNFASWSSRHFHQDWFGLALPRHLTHFTPATLGQMVESAGFQVASIDQTPRDGWIRKSARRALKRRDNPGTARLLRRRWLAMPVARWTEFTGQADSIRLIAEKPATAEAAM